MRIERQALALIARIYEAASDARQWQVFVEELAQAYGDASVGFAFQLPGFPVQGVFIEHGMRPVSYTHLTLPTTERV